MQDSDERSECTLDAACFTKCEDDERRHATQHARASPRYREAESAHARARPDEVTNAPIMRIRTP
ncbi:hypothetical protein DB771_16835 [Burkholderia sp. AU29985]|nr:hypothetical protein XM57_20075 [Burkholderia cepacia]AYZ94686.1 hypothetical protein EGY28_06210 [Burkholderia dolosa]ETP63830.1 hypothetical protein BDSB_23830 [Burkholderia dolosa PC543]PRE56119.1 hypothetical protein C6P87_03205 [Burkholderia sp. AU12872]PUA75719.1 hypothetical protein DB771_16835 [Burkholderia sp. AU29985]